MKSFEPVYGHISADIAVLIANLFMCGFTLECLIRGIAEGTRARFSVYLYKRNARRRRLSFSLYSNRSHCSLLHTRAHAHSDESCEFPLYTFVGVQLGFIVVLQFGVPIWYVNLVPFSHRVRTVPPLHHPNSVGLPPLTNASFPPPSSLQRLFFYR